MSGDRIVSNRETGSNPLGLLIANAKAITVLVGASVLGVILTLQGLALQIEDEWRISPSFVLTV